MPLVNEAGKRFLPAALLVAFSIGIYVNALPNPFMWDDNDLIVESRHIKDPKNIPFLLSPGYWKNYYPGDRAQYRPVGIASLALDHILWKENPAGYRLVNIVIHGLNTLLMYLILAGMARGGGEKDRAAGGFMAIPFLAALFFACHPMHTESVAWVKNRFDLLSMFFFLASFALFIRSAPRKGGPGLGLIYGASILSFMLALLSKEIAVTLPFVLVLYAVSFLSARERGRALGAAIPHIAISALFLMWRFSALSGMASGGSAAGPGMYERVLVIVKTMGCYVMMLLAPAGLNAERMLDVPQSIAEPAVLGSAALLSLIAVVVARNIRSLDKEATRNIIFGIMWVLITLLPASNILFLSSRPIAEQRLYLPSFGACLAMAAALTGLYSSNMRFPEGNAVRRLALSIAALITILYSFITIDRNLDWRDPVTFWSETIEASPRSARAHNNLGVTYYDQGRAEEALASYVRAIGLDPGYLTPRNNAGVAYARLDRLDEAAACFSEVIGLDPGYLDAYSNLGNIYTMRGQGGEAMEMYKKALEIDPEHADAHNNLAVLYYYQKRYDLAVDHAHEAARLGAAVNPGFTDALKALGEKGDTPRGL